MSNERRRERATQLATALLAGRRAYWERRSPFDNPHTPTPPGNAVLARLWRTGYRSAARINPLRETTRQRVERLRKTEGDNQ